ncbi:MAG: MarC family protein [Candidatus Hodarchaeota archaeon]
MNGLTIDPMIMFELSFVLLVMVNPFSKMLVVSVISEKSAMTDREIILRSNLVGLAILIVFCIFGTALMQYVFNIGIDALRIAGGVVVFLIGFEFLWKGELKSFAKAESTAGFEVVPLGTPLITGPSVITTTIVSASQYGYLTVILAGILAIGYNTGAMLVGSSVSNRINPKILGALIRILGLFTAAIGVQMMLTGIRNYILTELAL